jgi:NUMOD4 motif
VLELFIHNITHDQPVNTQRTCFSGKKIFYIRSMKAKQFPYQNRLLVDLKGELWDDIPGLDGCFVISNFGRIKRMRREQVTKNGANPHTGASS